MISSFQSRGEVKRGAGIDWPSVFTSLYRPEERLEEVVPGVDEGGLRGGVGVVNVLALVRAAVAAQPLEKRL